MAKGNREELNEQTDRVFAANAKLLGFINRLGDKIAQEHGYESLHDMEAIHRYLIDKYHWLPHHVRS